MVIPDFHTISKTTSLLSITEAYVVPLAPPLRQDSVLRRRRFPGYRASRPRIARTLTGTKRASIKSSSLSFCLPLTTRQLHKLGFSSRNVRQTNAFGQREATSPTLGRLA